LPADQRKITRRDFLRRMVYVSLGTVIVASGAATACSSPENVIDPYPITEEISQQQIDESSKLSFHISDLNINDINYKLFGVSHTREFAEQHYNTIDKLVEGSSGLVLEGDPYLLYSGKMYNDAHAYYGTVINLVHKYKKPIISFDPLSDTARSTEKYTSSLGVTITLTLGASALYFRSKLSRRKFIGLLASALGGAYLTIGSGPVNDLTDIAVNGIIGSEIESSKFIVKKHSFAINHMIDQRNVELTERLKGLPKIYDMKEFEPEGYFLVNMGMYHTLGIDYYMKHPRHHRLKSMLYSFNYDLIDNNTIKLYVPTANGWDIKVLKA